MRIDARWFQIGSLAVLLAINIAWFDLGARWDQGVLTLTSTLAAQAAFSRMFGVKFEYKSALITGLSLSILLRSNEPALWLAAGVLAIGSKFLLRVGGKHLFNPAAFAIVALLLACGGRVWVSPGQWGAQVWLGLLVAGCGTLVLARSSRIDLAIAFIASYGGLLLWRAWYLGDPWQIPLHQLQIGSLLIFTCFMITDPRSTPDRRTGRVLFAAAVALLAYRLQFYEQLRTALYLALVAVSVATPAIDFILPAERFRWRPQEA
jgi:Na+-transporting NADH:ubiquinone oxidoreductase subunit NqrB